MCDCNRPPTDKPAQPALYAETAARFTLVALGAVTLANGLAPKVLAKIPAYESWLPFVPPFIYLAAGVILAVILKASLTATCVFPMAQLSDREVAGIFSGKDEAARTRIIGQRAAMAGRLAKALTFKTISWEPSPLDAKVASELKIHQEAPPASDNATDYAEFDKLHAFLKASFPQAFAKLDVHYVNKYSLVMVWKGSEPKQQPYMLAAHLDVVPTPDLHNWKEDPFAGTIKDGFVWGRGAIDDKHSALGWLETIEDLLKSGFKPKRSIYFAFGHDEEVGGFQGAAHIAKWIAQNVGPRDCFEFILDEGLFIIDGAVPGHKKPIAFVCVAEKGYLSVELTVTCEPGHSSTPPAETAIGILSKAVKRIEDSPLPAHFNGPARSMFSGLREYAGALKYIVFNLWLFGPVLSWVLQRKSQTNSIVRTTTALTQFNAGVKDNVIPSSARAIINHRIHPFDTIESVIAWDTAAVADVRVKIRPYSVPVPPAPVSDSEHAAFFDIRSAVHRVHGGAVAVTPGMMVGATDTRHYWNFSPQIYRFNPILLHSDDVKMFHGFNERIAVDNYAEVVLVFRELILAADARNVVAAESRDFVLYPHLLGPLHDAGGSSATTSAAAAAKKSKARADNESDGEKDVENAGRSGKGKPSSAAAAAAAASSNGASNKSSAKGSLKSRSSARKGTA